MTQHRPQDALVKVRGDGPRAHAVSVPELLAMARLLGITGAYELKRFGLPGDLARREAAAAVARMTELARSEVYQRFDAAQDVIDQLKESFRRARRGDRWIDVEAREKVLTDAADAAIQRFHQGALLLSELEGTLKKALGFYTRVLGLQLPPPAAAPNADDVEESPQEEVRRLAREKEIPSLRLRRFHPERSYQAHDGRRRTQDGSDKADDGKQRRERVRTPARVTDPERPRGFVDADARQPKSGWIVARVGGGPEDACVQELVAAHRARAQRSAANRHGGVLTWKGSDGKPNAARVVVADAESVDTDEAIVARWTRLVLAEASGETAWIIGLAFLMGVALRTPVAFRATAPDLLRQARSLVEETGRPFPQALSPVELLRRTAYVDSGHQWRPVASIASQKLERVTLGRGGSGRRSLSTVREELRISHQPEVSRTVQLRRLAAYVGEQGGREVSAREVATKLGVGRDTAAELISALGGGSQNARVPRDHG